MVSNPLQHRQRRAKPRGRVRQLRIKASQRGIHREQLTKHSHRVSQADEYLRLLETSYRRNADLLKKVIQEQSSGSGVESRTREWLEASIAAARDTAQDVASTNLRVAQAWTEAFAKGTQRGVPGAPARAAPKAAAGK